MLTLADALNEVLSAGDGWAGRALNELGIHEVAEVQVCAASAGWIRATSAPLATDAPAVFVLLPDRVGCGTSATTPGSPRWIALADITALEAMDEPHTALDTVEVHTRSGVVTVGWSPSFCRSVVDMLSQQDHSAPSPSDASSLDSLEPSSWTEPPVAPASVSAALPPPPPDWAVPAVAAPAAVETPPASVPAAVAGPAGPWLNPSVLWPDPIRGVAYVGGHPDHPRRRKNATLTFTPNGCVLEGGGLSSWYLIVPWSDVDRLSIQNSEELEFCAGIKVDAASSALTIELASGEHVVIEVRMRRPPSLRATLAPVLAMSESIGGWRAEVERLGR